MIYLALLFAIIGGISSGYQGPMQRSTLYIGKIIAPFEMSHRIPRGYQDAITHPRFWKIQCLTPISIVVFLIAGFLAGWYWIPILWILVFLPISLIIRSRKRKDIEYYLNIIIDGMVEKKENYLKKNDNIRAAAANDMIDILIEYLDEIKGSGIIIPSMSYINNMPVGGYNDKR